MNENLLKSDYGLWDFFMAAALWIKLQFEHIQFESKNSMWFPC